RRELGQARARVQRVVGSGGGRAAAARAGGRASGSAHRARRPGDRALDLGARARAGPAIATRPGRGARVGAAGRARQRPRARAGRWAEGRAGAAAQRSRGRQQGTELMPTKIEDSILNANERASADKWIAKHKTASPSCANATFEMDSIVGGYGWRRKVICM